MPEMPRQNELLRNVKWDVLCVLDACRWDVFRDVTGGGEAVESDAIATPQWVQQQEPLMVQRNALYFTAMPAVWKQDERMGNTLDLVKVCKTCWGKHTEDDQPGVHPEAINASYMAYRELGHVGDRPVVLHYGQPHVPYIGDYRVVAEPSRGWTGLRAGTGKGYDTWKLARAGTVRWDDIRRAYAANLRLAWRSVRNLLRHVDGLVAVTADHGEVFGDEHPVQTGHGHRANYPEQQTVPWLVVESEAKETTVLEKMKALGYA